MNKEEPYREQAERLKRRIEKINDSIEATSDELPPREQLHREKKAKVKMKLKYPVIRILVLFFILLPVIIFSAISYLNGKNGPASEPASTDSVGYETINLEKTKSEEHDKTEPEEQDLPEVEQEAVEANEPEENATDSQPVNATEAVPEPQSTSNDIQPVSGAPADKNSQPETQPTNKTTTNPTKAQTIIYHKVQPKETLFRLAMKYYNSQKGMETIKRANGLKSEEIYIGQVLKIPR
jgi:outer membrane biosynthesis protein TonB